MTSDGLREVFEAYLDTHDPTFFIEDAVLVLAPHRRTVRGRPAIAAVLQLLFRETLLHGWVETQSVILDVARGVGAAELVFKGRHVRTLMGIRGTGEPVAIPMLEFVEFRHGRISRARLYCDLTDLPRWRGRGSLLGVPSQ